eukprot:Unigene8071_Nuclearia_a/m.24746 Unigene8071_Nuclearia_a/g.24746  ORF Unigene8071_Nuclearia_a/g.24746 Unigene8071_Nuclearia_a/m.24746 type:complete len:407 (+) Unigene8071_Nuclearia_a:68-1288(+)
MPSRRRKRRTHVKQPDAAGKVPRSFVLASGQAGKSVRQLVRDFRRVMEPNTAVKLQDKSSNRLKDFVAIAGPFGVTHLVLFRQTDAGTNVRLARMPRGPTLQFRIDRYTLAHDVLAAQTKQRATGAEFNTAPLLVMNGFNGGDNKLQLMSTFFQNMFPPINVKEMKLANVRRVLLINYNKDTDRVEIRHYLILAAPVGISKSIKRLVQTNIPDLASYNDISDYILKEDALSDSDAEDGDSRVELGQNYVGRGNTKSQQRAIRLKELGPRLELRLIKVQAGFCDGDVLYHDFIAKSAAEIKTLKAKRKAREELKAQRRAEQEANVQRKQAALEQKQQQKKRRRAEGGAAVPVGSDDDGDGAGADGDDELDGNDDADENDDDDVLGDPDDDNDDHNDEWHDADEADDS